MTNLCMNCRFFAAGFFECRRHAPVAVDVSWRHPEAGLQAEVRSFWPPVAPDAWCGDHEGLLPMIDPDFDEVPDV